MREAAIVCDLLGARDAHRRITVYRNSKPNQTLHFILRSLSLTSEK
jgi:hypothetical protein